MFEHKSFNRENNLHEWIQWKVLARKGNTPLKLNFSLHVIIEVGDALITISEYINLAFKEYKKQHCTQATGLTGHAQPIKVGLNDILR